MNRETAKIHAMIDFMGSRIPRADAFKNRLTIKFSNRAKGSYGGWSGGPTMTIGLNDNGRHTDRDAWIARMASRDPSLAKRSWKEAIEGAKRDEWWFIEYSHINKDPEIGAFKSDNAEHHMDALLAHELSHAIQYWIKYESKYFYDTTGKDFSAHGEIWRDLYRALRNEFINPYLDRPAKQIQAKIARPRSTGMIARCWEHFDECIAEGLTARPDMILTGTLKGLTKGTLSTQYSKWKKTQ